MDCKRLSNEQVNSSKAAKTILRGSNSSIPLQADVNNSDLVKTKTVSNGNKALTNNVIQQDSNSDRIVTVPSDTKINSENEEEKKCENEANCQKEENYCSPDKSGLAQSVRGKVEINKSEIGDCLSNQTILANKFLVMNVFHNFTGTS